MSRLFIEGYETGELGFWDVVQSDFSVIASSGPGMYGSYCLDVPAAQYYIKKNLSAPSLTSLYVAMKLKTKSSLPVVPISIGLDDGQYLFLFGFDVDFKNYFYHGASLLDVSANPVYSTSTKYLLEAYFKLGTTDGRFTLKLDGNIVQDFTGNTKGSATKITNIRHGHPGVFLNTSGNCYVDDTILDDANWIGETFIVRLPISGDGVSSQWTPSTGSNWDCVDETPYNDSDYVHSYVPGPLDLYTQSGLTFSIGTVKAIDCRIRSLQTSSPTPVSLSCALRSGLTNFLSAGITIASATKFNDFIFETNPITGVAFTESELGELQFGMKLN